MKKGKTRKPMGRAGSMLVSLLITGVIGFAYFYVSLPAVNPQSGDFYRFLGLLCVVYTICVTYGLLMKNWLIVAIFLLIYPLTMTQARNVQI